ncbi:MULTISPECIES: Mut7-C RNAse domain-containing protein [unclassified Saccharicrinis]|uniref:Mut7-C RNAse domain-containing protein n=1 Tax=unclassified Saccharicrinis TaxID=2646859 RepID=UPI003D35999A
MRKDKHIWFRFYAELNDFLTADKKQVSFKYAFIGPLKVEEAILSMRVPLSEIDLILINSQPQTLDYFLNHNDYVSVYPVFECFDISPINKLRKEPLRRSTFILDVHLGKLAKFLRMAGLDTLYSDRFEDSEIIDISLETGRIILTRDRQLLHSKRINHGYFVRNIDPLKQFKEVLAKFNLGSQLKPMMRCLKCNNPLEPINKTKVLNRIKPAILNRFDTFYTCKQCNHIYWKGSHYERMTEFLASVRHS